MLTLLGSVRCGACSETVSKAALSNLRTEYKALVWSMDES